MEENIIYTSHNIHVFELLYNMLNKYNIDKKNIISLLVT